MKSVVKMLKTEEKKLYKEYKDMFFKYGKKATRTIKKRTEWRIVASTLVNLGISLF